MRHDSLGCHAPISPPPTLPTRTRALPPLDDLVPFPLASIQELDDSETSLFVNSSSLTRDDSRGDQPPSPVSPEWATNGIPPEIPQSPERSFLLHKSRFDLFDYATEEESSHAESSTSRPLSLPLEHVERPLPQHPWDDLSPPVSSLPLSPPASPIPQKLHLHALDSPMFEEDCMSLPSEDPMSAEDLRLLSSPSLHSHSLPISDDFDMQEILEDHDKANTLHIDTQDNTDHSLSPPPSPGQSFLALPGADPDDELYFPEPETEVLTYSPLYPNASGRSLLLIDDPNDVPPPRSPSPENFQLDPSQLALEGCTDPEIRRLWDLRKKSQAAERAARVQETQALELGAAGVGAKWDARQIRKQEKERGREIAAMLRLKLAEKGVKVDDRDRGSVSDTDGAGAGAGVDGDHYGTLVDREEKERGRPTKLKRKIGSMEQLVARMLLRRHSTSRSIINRRSPVQSYSKSPLSRRAVSAEDPDGVMDLDDEDDWGLELRSWPMQ